MAEEIIGGCDSVVGAVAEAAGPFAAAVRLLELAEPDATALDGDHDSLEQFGRVRDAVQDAFVQSADWNAFPTSLSQAGTEGLGVADLALAVAYGLDDAAHTGFSREWLDERDEPFELAIGDRFPVQDMPLALDRYSSRPDRLGVRRGDLPHVRRRPAGEERVLVEPRFADEVDGLLAGNEVRVAVLLPNATLDEFEFSSFPVVPLSPGHQADLIAAAIDHAVDEGCRVIVGPECAVPPESLQRISDAANRASPPAIIFAGSAHRMVGGAKVNLAPVFVGAEQSWSHRKMSRFETTRDGKRFAEGIDLEVPPTLTVATGAHVRVAGMICKDVLDVDRARLVGELGIHLLGVPAMSATVNEFAAVAHEIVRRSQGVMVLANNPLRWNGESVSHGLMSRPLRDDVGRVLRTEEASPPGLAIGVLQEGWQPFVTIGA